MPKKEPQPNELEDGEAWERQTMPPDRVLDAHPDPEQPDDEDEVEDLIVQSDAREEMEDDETDQVPQPQRGKKHVVTHGDDRSDAGARLDSPTGGSAEVNEPGPGRPTRGSGRPTQSKAFDGKKRSKSK